MVENDQRFYISENEQIIKDKLARETYFAKAISDSTIRKCKLCAFYKTNCGSIAPRTPSRRNDGKDVIFELLDEKEFIESIKPEIPLSTTYFPNISYREWLIGQIINRQARYSACITATPRSIFELADKIIDALGEDGTKISYRGWLVGQVVDGMIRNDSGTSQHIKDAIAVVDDILEYARQDAEYLLSKKEE